MGNIKRNIKFEARRVLFLISNSIVVVNQKLDEIGKVSSYSYGIKEVLRLTDRSRLYLLPIVYKLDPN